MRWIDELVQQMKIATNCRIGVAVVLGISVTSVVVSWSEEHLCSRVWLSTRWIARKLINRTGFTSIIALRDDNHLSCWFLDFIITIISSTLIIVITDTCATSTYQWLIFITTTTTTLLLDPRLILLLLFTWQLLLLTMLINTWIRILLGFNSVRQIRYHTRSALLEKILSFKTLDQIILELLCCPMLSLLRMLLLYSCT